MLELNVNLDAEQVLQECERRGLVVRSERELGGCRRGRHWHLHIPGRPGTPELSDCRGQVSLKVHPRRDGGWASTLAAELHAASKAMTAFGGRQVDPGLDQARQADLPRDPGDASSGEAHARTVTGR